MANVKILGLGLGGIVLVLVLSSVGFVNGLIGRIPVVGKYLAMPGKILGGLLSKIPVVGKLFAA